MTTVSDVSPPASTPAEPPRRDRLTPILDGIDNVLESVAGALLVATVIIALTQVFYRYVLNDSLAWPEEVARWVFVWLVFLGGALVSRRGGHIVIDMVPLMLGPRALAWHAVMVRVVVAAVATMLIVIGSDMAARSSYVSPAMQWSLTYLYLAIPTGASLTLLFAAVEPVGGWRSRWSGLVSSVVGIIAFYLVYRYVDISLVRDFGVAWTLLVFAVGTMMIGIPIVDSLLLGTFIAFLPEGEMFLVTVPQNMTASLDSFLLLAIPFFIVAAGIMNVAGITDKLIALSAALVGHLRGGLGHVNVITNTLMGGISGSSMADAAAIAKTMVPAMEKRGFPRPFGCALTGSAAILANMIPPSMGLIIYGALASVSVGALFVATIVPGILMAVALSIVVHFEVKRRGFGLDLPRATAAERWHATKVAIPALILPVVIVGGIRFGMFTATEAGAVAALYALLCGLFVYRITSFASIVTTVRQSLLETISVMVIIAASAPFAWILVADQVPQKLAAGMGALTSNWLLLMFVLNLFLLFVGLAMEMIASMVILVPILVPMLKAANIDLVHFGVILVGNLCIGALTPPLGILLFTTAKVTGTPIGAVFRACNPFMVGLIIWLYVISFIPALSLLPVKWLGP